MFRHCSGFYDVHQRHPIPASAGMTGQAVIQNANWTPPSESWDHAGVTVVAE